MHARPLRNSLNNTLSFIRDLDRARNLDDVASQVMRHVAPFGIDFVAATTIPNEDEKSRAQFQRVLVNRWPEEWMKRYLSRRYAFRDPAFVRVRNDPTTPFFWDQLRRELNDDLDAERILDESSEFGLREGFTVALTTLDGQLVVWSFGGRQIDPRLDTSPMLTLIASYTTARAIILKQDPRFNEPIILTPREREALQWAAEGKNDWEIGAVMNISEHGADKHLRTARTKLGAINRTQAVAEAIRRGLIA